MLRRWIPCWIALGLAAPGPAQIPDRVSFQGRLVEDGQPVTGMTSFEIRLFDAATGGTPLHSESELVTLDAQGTFFTEIGDDGPALDPLIFTQPTWVDLVYGGLDLVPRVEVLPAPTALLAKEAMGIRNGNLHLLELSSQTVTAPASSPMVFDLAEVLFYGTDYLYSAPVTIEETLDLLGPLFVGGASDFGGDTVFGGASTFEEDVEAKRKLSVVGDLDVGGTLVGSGGFHYLTSTSSFAFGDTSSVLDISGFVIIGADEAVQVNGGDEVLVSSQGEVRTEAPTVTIDLSGGLLPGRRYGVTVGPDIFQSLDAGGLSGAAGPDTAWEFGTTGSSVRSPEVSLISLTDMALSATGVLGLESPSLISIEGLTLVSGEVQVEGGGVRAKQSSQLGLRDYVPPEGPLMPTGGSISIQSSFVVIDGSAPATPLSQILGGLDGDHVTLYKQPGGQSVQVQHAGPGPGNGQILLDSGRGRPFLMQNPGDNLSLVRFGNDWFETCRTVNGP